jgi:hypothetical protein
MRRIAVMHIGHIFHRRLLVGLSGLHIHARHVRVVCAHSRCLRFLFAIQGSCDHDWRPMIWYRGQQHANHEKCSQASPGSSN